MGHLMKIIFSSKNGLPNKHANYSATNETLTVKFELILPVKKKILFYKSPSFVCGPAMNCSSQNVYRQWLIHLIRPLLWSSNIKLRNDLTAFFYGINHILVGSLFVKKKTRKKAGSDKDKRQLQMNASNRGPQSNQLRELQSIFQNGRIPIGDRLSF